MRLTGATGRIFPYLPVGTYFPLEKWCHALFFIETPVAVLLV
jgi:hypothetical protein